MTYSTAVLERLRDPKHAGWLPRDDRTVGTGEAGALDTGTLTRIQIRVDAETQRITEAVFKVFGCSAAIASTSLLTERLQGIRIADALAIDALTIVGDLELPMDRAHVASMAVTAARAAIEDWERKAR
jgi:NifU-like protein involved in Fe-S cluster formation